MPSSAGGGSNKQTEKATKEAQMAAQGLNPDGTPIRPDYLGYTNPDGTLKDPFKLGPHSVGGNFSVDPNSFGIDAKGYVIPKFDEVTMDPAALNQIKEQAFNQGPSAWAQMLNLQQGRSQQDAYDMVANQGAGANAQAMGDLSRLGGLSSGAMERLATNTQKNNAFNQNAVLRQGMTDRGNIGLADQAQKTQLLQAIPGYERSVADLKLQNNAAATDVNKFNTLNQIDLSKYNTTNTVDLNKYNQTMAADLAKYNNTVAAQTDQFNIGNQLKDIEGKNAFGQGVYSDQMKAWAAQQQANATQYQADHSGGSWLCTEAGKTIHFEEVQKKLLSDFMRQAMKIDRETTRFYLLRCQPLLEKMKEKGANWMKNAQFVMEIIELNDMGRVKEAFDLYCDYTIACIEKYWPECRDPSFYRIQQIRKQIAKGA
jgi:hypothetical protein